MSRGLTFAIYPADGDSVSLNLFHKTIQDIRRLVYDVDYAISRESDTRRWVIVELRSSIPTVTLRPFRDVDKTIKTFVNGIRLVAIGSSEPPNYFTEQALEDLKKMRRLFTGRDRAKRIEFSHDGQDKTIIAEDIAGKVEIILGGGYSNLGSIDGTLEAVNLHGSPTFTIWDRVSKAPVRCYFPKEHGWKNQVKSLLEKRVLVSGKVNYFQNGLPRSITETREIEDATPDPTLPKATFGSIPNEEASRGSAEFLKRVRSQSW